MGIVSSVIIEDSEQGNTGKRSIREKHIDHLGKEHYVSYKLDVGVDEIVVMNNRVAEIEKGLEQAEIQKYIDIARAGIEINPAATTDYATKAQVLKALIKETFLFADHTIAFSIIAIIDSLTDAQLKNIVGITQVKVNKIRNRITNLKLIRTAVNDDLVDVEEPE